MLVLLGCSVFTFAITRQDLEQIQSELRNPITLESIDSILLESGSHFEKKINHYSNRPEYQGLCLFSADEFPVYISVEFDHVATNSGSYKEKRIVRKIGYGSNKNHPAYRFVDGRFQYYDDPYWSKDDEKRKEVLSLIEKSNSILDKIDQLKLTCMSSTRCKGAFQGLSLYQVSDMLGSHGICNGSSSTFQTCNYRVNLEDGTIADISIEYINSGVNYTVDYTPLFIMLNDATDLPTDATPIRTVKIGKQEWMDHNLLYGEGRTVKYGVDIVANKDLSNITYGDYESKSAALPSGERNSWFVLMDLNLFSKDYGSFLEKPDIKNNHQGACPAGFHVPTRKEWKELFSFVAKDKVKFLKYDLFDEYKKARDELPSNFELAFASASELKKYHKQQKKLESIENELDAAYNKWRKGKKDGFDCNKGANCRYNKHDMQEVIEREIVQHLCSKGTWPLDENGDDLCLDSYGFSMPSNTTTGNDISYWIAEAKVSQCRDVFENGRHQCTYNIEGYGFSIKSEWQNFKLSNFETMLGNANLRCLKNRSKK